MTNDKTTPINDADLDDVQGGLNYEKIEWTAQGKARRTEKGIVLSSETHEPTVKDTGGKRILPDFDNLTLSPNIIIKEDFQ